MRHPNYCKGHCDKCGDFICAYRGWDKSQNYENDRKILTTFKDGSILSCCGPGEDKCTFICSGSYFGNPIAYCGISTNGNFIVCNRDDKTPWTYGLVRLATPEEINVLYEKMYKTDYRWCHKTCKLIKI